MSSNFSQLQEMHAQVLQDLKAPVLAQVAFQEDQSNAARQELTAELELQQLSRTRGGVGSHSFTATAADPRLRQRHRAKEMPRRSTSMLPNHFQ